MKQCLAIGIRKSLQKTNNNVLNPLKTLLHFIEMNTLGNPQVSSITNSQQTDKWPDSKERRKPVIEMLSTPTGGSTSYTSYPRAFNVDSNNGDSVTRFVEQIPAASQLPFQLYNKQTIVGQPLLVHPKFKDVPHNGAKAKRQLYR